jgi:hypothetical protein
MSKRILLFAGGILAASLLSLFSDDSPPPSEPSLGRSAFIVNGVSRQPVENISQNETSQHAAAGATSNTSSEIAEIADTTGTGNPEKETWEDPLTEAERAEVNRQFEEQSRRHWSTRMAVLNAEEKVDPEWAPLMERRMENFVAEFLRNRPSLFERYAVTSIECRTTVCRIEVSDYGTGELLRGGDPIRDLEEELIRQPWGTRFDNPDTHAIGSSEFGYLQYGFYFKRAEADQSQIQEVATSSAG